MRSEKDLQDYILKRCKYYAIIGYKFDSPSCRGVPDLILINQHGRTYFAEIKSPAGTGRLSPLQKKQIARIRKNGATVYVIDSKEYADECINEIITDRRAIRND